MWNHRLSASNFSWSDWTETTGGTPLPVNLKTWSGSTKLCLSCHDGTVELGDIYMPGGIMSFDANKIGGTEQIGPDLKGTHPVGVPYPYNRVKNTYNGITTGDNALASGWVATPTKVKLFTDPASAGPNNRGIECGSCHVPLAPGGVRASAGAGPGGDPDLRNGHHYSANPFPGPEK
jgi:hypothetical protein